MIQIITEHSIAEMLLCPADYVDQDEDIVLLKVLGEDITNPTILMLGYDDKAGSYYFIVEDNEVSEDIYCEKNRLTEMYGKIIEDLVKEGVVKNENCS